MEFLHENASVWSGWDPELICYDLGPLGASWKKLLGEGARRLKFQILDSAVCMCVLCEFEPFGAKLSDLPCDASHTQKQPVWALCTRFKPFGAKLTHLHCKASNMQKLCVWAFKRWSDSFHWPVDPGDQLFYNGVSLCTTYWLDQKVSDILSAF